MRCKSDIVIFACAGAIWKYAYRPFKYLKVATTVWSKQEVYSPLITLFKLFSNQIESKTVEIKNANYILLPWNQQKKDLNLLHDK